MKNKKFILHFTLVLLASLFYFIANFQRIAVPGAIFDLLKQDLSVTAPYITAFGAIFMYIYAFNQLVIGVLVDKFGGLRVILAGACILALGCLLFPISSSLTLMYFSRALIGLGSSTFYLSLIKELKKLFSDRNFGLAISVMLFIGYTGGIAANAPFVMMMKFANWREILFAVGCVVVLTLVIFCIILPKISLVPINKSARIRTLPFKVVLHKRHNRNLFSFACCNFGISYVIQTVIGKKFLEDFCLISSAKAAVILSIMAIVAAVFNIINASVCKMCHNHRVIFLKCASVITFFCLFIVCLMIAFDIKSMFIAVVFCVLAGNASLSSLLIPVLHLSNRKIVSTTAVSVMNFCFFMMVGILGTATGFILNIFEPTRVGNVLVYSNNSYLLLFGLFLALSMFEMYKAAKLSNKY